MDAAADEKESTGRVFLAMTIPKRVSLTVGPKGSHDDCGNDDDDDSWFGLEANKEFLSVCIVPQNSHNADRQL